MEGEAILSVVCIEKEGEVERKIYPFILTEESIKRLYEESSKYPYFFGKVTPPTLEEFFQLYFKLDPSGLLTTDSIIWVVDDYVGILVLSNIYFPNDALMHFSFFDGRLRGRHPIIREMIKYVFSEFGLLRMSAEIPAFVVNKAKSKDGVLRFISNSVGLKLEGKKRKAIEFVENDETRKYDVLLYGIIPEDMKEWEPQKPKQ